MAGDPGRRPLLDPRDPLCLHRPHDAEAAMIPAAWRAGEIAVIGLGKSGRSVAALLRREGIPVYVSDAGTSDALDEAAATLRALGAEVDVGAHDLARIARAAVVVASPGVPPSAPPLAA